MDGRAESTRPRLTYFELLTYVERNCGYCRVCADCESFRRTKSAAKQEGALFVERDALTGRFNPLPL